ncbi:MAG: hypothetical protein LBD80_08435, partial [Tannerella sp.]|nr:hypothetical protein [Tannerella sp.]
MEIRRQHPRMGGEKMYYLSEDLAKELHIGRDKFYEILKENDLLVNKKISRVRTTKSYHRFHVYNNELFKASITGT